MKISSEKTDLKKTYLAIATMLLAILCIDLYMVIIKFLGNKPLILHTVEHARKIFNDQQICVSTDSEEIKRIVENEIFIN